MVEGIRSVALLIIAPAILLVVLVARFAERVQQVCPSSPPAPPPLSTLDPVGRENLVLEIVLSFYYRPEPEPPEPPPPPPPPEPPPLPPELPPPLVSFFRHTDGVAFNFMLVRSGGIGIRVHKMAKKSLRTRHCSHCLRPGIVNIAGGGLEPRPVMLTMPGCRQCEQCLIRQLFFAIFGTFAN
ncbi:hypothetical protein M0804_009929 [Polistes exclamans]|nr:hypothetical protein M0804_009929 [Polistes exclamans]